MASKSSSKRRSKNSDVIIGGRWRLGEKIGRGTFGVVYSAVDIETGEMVAAKCDKSTRSQLLNESTFYKEVFAEGTGIPRFYWYGEHKHYNVLVMELLGKSLSDLFHDCSKRFSLKTVLMLADQMIGVIESVHKKYWIHRDIKPENFVIGVGDYSNQVFLIDYGLAREYYNPEMRFHYPYSERRPLVGTVRYCSTRSQRGIEQSPRDDLESLANMLIYFLRGSLPWQGIQAPKKQRPAKVLEVKMGTRLEDLCEGLPEEFLLFYKYVRRLHYDHTPDYNYLRQMFRNRLHLAGYVDDRTFDWDLLPSSPTKDEMKTHAKVMPKGRRKADRQDNDNE